MSVPAGSLIDGIYVNVSVDVVAPKRLHKELLAFIRRISVDICLGLRIRFTTDTINNVCDKRIRLLDH